MQTHDLFKLGMISLAAHFPNYVNIGSSQRIENTHLFVFKVSSGKSFVKLTEGF